MATTAKGRAIKGVEAIFDRYHLIAKKNKFLGFDKALMSELKILDATPEGTVTFSLYIDEKYTNLNGVMHGGAAGVIFDMATTTALGPLARPGYWDFMGGVTRSLNISYLRAVPLNTNVRLHSTVLQAGRTMALIRGSMTSEDGKTVYCTCEHHKVNVPSLPEHMAFKVDWDGLWDAKGAAKL